jgi:hypothetical protein
MAVSVVFRSHHAAGLGSLQLGYDDWRPLTTPPDSPAIFPGVYSTCANRARAAGLGSDTGRFGRLRLQGERTPQNLQEGLRVDFMFAEGQK